MFLTGVGWSWVSYHLESTIEEYPMNVIATNFNMKFLADVIYDPTNYDGDSCCPIFHLFYESTTQTELPSPSVSADTSSLSMSVGETKDITFTVSNKGGESDTDSYLSVSVSSGLQIEEWSSSSSDMIFVHSPVGSEIVNSVGEKIISEYELLDAYEAYSCVFG